MKERKISILVIDDEPLLSKSLVAIFQSKGFDIKSTAFGKEGLQWLKEGFDVVLLDLKLPDIDGLEVLRQIKLNYPDTLVIVVTAFASVDKVASIINQGAYSYVSKPFEVDELQTIITRGLEEKTKDREKDKLLDDFSLLHQVSRELEGMIELHSIADLSARYLIEIIQLDICAVLLLDEATKDFFFGSISGIEFDINYLIQKRFKLEPKMHERLIIEHNAVLIPEIKTKPDILKYIPIKEPKSMFIFPLIAKNKVVGLSLFVGKKQVVLDDKILATVTTISNEIAHCIDNANLYLKLKRSYLEAVSALVNAIEGKDRYQRGHSEVVAELAALVAKKMQLPRQEIELVKFAGLLHDIGKIGISEQILLKKDKLTSDEYVKLKMHSIISTSIVRRIDTDNKLFPMVLHHHERFDGTGYPEGLRGNAIPIGARILAVCDSYKAMISNRPYRQGLKQEEAVRELQRCSGTQFDPKVVEAFIDIIFRAVI